MFKLNDPIYVAHSGFYLNQQNEISPIALATVGFITKLDVTTARFCLYLLLKIDSPTINTKKRNPPSIVVRKRDTRYVLLNYRNVPRIPTIQVFVDKCDEQFTP